MVHRRWQAIAAGLIAAGLGVGCGEPRAPTPSGTAARPPRTALTAAELQRLRERVPTLRAGMTRAEVLAALAVDLDGLGQIGTGPASETTTIYLIGGPDQLDLTWDARDQARPVLLRAALTPRAAP